MNTTTDYLHQILQNTSQNTSPTTLVALRNKINFTNNIFVFLLTNL